MASSATAIPAAAAIAPIRSAGSPDTSSAPLSAKLTVTSGARSSLARAVAYFIVSEALTNVVKHAQATRAEVTVTRVGDVLRIAVTDDGRGGAVPAADEAPG